MLRQGLCHSDPGPGSGADSRKTKKTKRFPFGLFYVLGPGRRIVIPDLIRNPEKLFGFTVLDSGSEAGMTKRGGRDDNTRTITTRILAW